MPSSYSSFAVILKIDPKSGSEGVIESEQSFVIPKLSVLHANGGSFTRCRFNLHMNAPFCFSQLLTQACYFLKACACALRACLCAHRLNAVLQSVESAADEDVPPHCPDPHPKWPLHVTSVSLCPASLRAPGRIGPTLEGRKACTGGFFFILMSHSTEQEQEKE